MFNKVVNLGPGVGRFHHANPAGCVIRIVEIVLPSWDRNRNTVQLMYGELTAEICAKTAGRDVAIDNAAVMDTVESNLVWKHWGLKDALVNALREFEASPTKMQCSCRTSEIRSESHGTTPAMTANHAYCECCAVSKVGTLGSCLFLIILGIAIKFPAAVGRK